MGYNKNIETSKGETKMTAQRTLWSDSDDATDTTQHAVTGGRKLMQAQEKQMQAEMAELDKEGLVWQVGDATGADTVATKAIKNGTVEMHKSQGVQPWQLAKRSTELAKEIAKRRGTLHIWAVSDCPATLHPCLNWPGGKASGTWKTAAVARGNMAKVVVHDLTNGIAKIPNWAK